MRRWLAPLTRVLIVFLWASPGLSQAVPVLDSVVPDRAAPGDEVLLTGSGFGGPGDTVEVVFSPAVAVTVNPSGSSIAVTVPQGAETGTVEVRVTHPVPGGDPLVQSSNSLVFQVIWHQLVADPIFPSQPGWYHGYYFANGLSQGYGQLAAGLSYWAASGSYAEYHAYSLDHSGAMEPGYGSSQYGGWGRFIQDPVSGHWYNFVRNGACTNEGPRVIRDLTAGAEVLTVPCGSPWQLDAFAFSLAGDLVVAAHTGDVYSGYTLGLWRFAPGDTTALDPSSPNALVPDVPSGADLWFPDLEVAADGTIWCGLGGNDMSRPHSIWRIPGADGSPWQVFEMPGSSAPEGPGFGYWRLATDCQGEAYAVNDCLTSDMCSGPFTIFRVSDQQPIAVVDGPEWFEGFANDAFANFYLWGNPPSGSGAQDVVYRVLPEQLPPGFYGYTVAKRHDEGPVEVNMPASSTPPPLLRLCNLPEAPPMCSDAAVQGLLRTLRTAYAARQSGHGFVDRDRIQRLAVQARQPVQRGVICPVIETGGTLVLDIGHADGTVTRAVEPLDGATVVLGEQLFLQAKWKDSTGETRIPVLWSLRDADPTWASAHPPEPGSKARVLFEDDVLLLFDEGHPDIPSSENLGQVVHSGTVILSASLSSDSAPDHLPHTLDVVISSQYAPRLGLSLDHHEYDDLINRFADAYGILPQVLKGLIDHESADWNSMQYRYEPAGWDYGTGLGGNGVKDQLGDNYLSPFRTEEGNQSGVGQYSRGSFTTTGEMDAWMASTPDRNHMMVAVYHPGTNSWECVDPLLISGTPVWTMAFYWGSNGVWIKPGDSRNRLSPCHRRLKWLKGVDIYDWVTSNPTSPPNTQKATEAAWWFYTHYYHAQTFLAASFGLTQIGYVTVAKGLSWRAGQPTRRDWQSITDPENNIYLGARWLVQNHVTGLPGKEKRLQAAAVHESARLDELMRTVLCAYNGRGARVACEYDDDVMLRSQGFVPQTRP